MESKIRLSEAIRLGAMLGPQVFGIPFGPHNGSCAMGAARFGIGLEKRLDEAFPWSYEMKISKACPSCGEIFIQKDPDNYISIGCSAGSIIVHLNDDHQWTREQIADWVESIDPTPKSDPDPGVDAVPETAEVHA